MKRRFSRYAALRRKFAAPALTPAYAVPVFAVLIGVSAAAAVISATPADTIRGLGDAVALGDFDQCFFSAYWRNSRYHILSAVASTSYLGLAAIPALMCCRGFTLCCTSAALIIDYGSRGALVSSLILGLPSLVTLPCLFAVAADSLTASADIFSLRFGLRQKTVPRSGLRRLMICLGAILPVTLFDCKIAPMLAALLL